MEIENRNLGTQPLDGIMIRLNLSNDDLVAKSTEQLTHKMVNRGRKGRMLTVNAQNKILRALTAAVPSEKFTLKDLFNYAGIE